ncbi:hypothetical protein EUX98_g6956 [Antrodiella citrinella]|uniref:Uncharacterized protein n=1 Tax=Antrodiella citrinella TaxID=2447956 RepID=A0A4S4MMR0_9APHY|nr:hypothetical protein EUX98_g6956 [Antrodiella citrinella]
MDCDRKDLRVLYTVDATLSEVPESDQALGWCQEFLTPEQFAFLGDRPQLHRMWGLYWDEQVAQPANTVSVIAYEYLIMLMRWHFHGVRGFGCLRITAFAWEDLRDLVLTQHTSKMIDLFDRYHFVVLTDYTIDLRDGRVKWEHRTQDVDRFVQRIKHIASSTLAVCWPSPEQARAMRKLHLIKKLDTIAANNTLSKRPWTREASGSHRRLPGEHEVGKMEGSEEGSGVILPGASEKRASEVWGPYEGKPFKYFLQQYAPLLPRLEYRVFVSGMRVLGVVKTAPVPNQSVSQRLREHIQDGHPDPTNFGSHNGGTPEERDRNIRESQRFVLQTHQELLRLVRQEVQPSTKLTLPACARYDISIFESDGKLDYFVNEIEWTPRMGLWYYERANLDEFLAVVDAFAASIWDLCATTPELRERWIDHLLAIDIHSLYH